MALKPRPPIWQDTRTRRALRGTDAPGASGGGGVGIGDPVFSGVAEELLYVDDSLNLAQTANARYKDGWMIHKNIGPPLAAELLEQEFIFSFETV